MSSDGRNTTFAGDRDGDFEICTVGVFGAEVRQLAGNGVDDRNPVWSPDDRWITYGGAVLFLTNTRGHLLDTS